MLRRKSNLVTLRKRIYVSTSPKRDTTEMRDDVVEEREKESSKNGEGAFLACAQLTSVLVKMKLGLQAKLFRTLAVIVDGDEKMCELYGGKSLMKLIL